MLYQSIIIAIAILSFLIVILLIAIVVKRVRRDLLLAHKLSLKKDYRHRINWFLSSEQAKSFPISRSENRKHRSVIQEVLLEFMLQANSIQQQKIQKLFKDLGYLEHHLKNLQSSNSLQRAISAEVLGEMKIKETVDVLIRLLEDPEEVVRLTCLRALGKIGGKKAAGRLVEALKDHYSFVPARVAEALHLVGKEAVIPLINLLDTDDPVVRTFAAQVLGEIGDKRAIIALRKALLDKSLDVRAKAALALGQMADKRMRFALEKALHDSEWPVRAAAAKALGQLKDPSSCHILAQAMTDQEWWVRTNAAQALANLGRPGEKALVKVLLSHDRYAQEKAAETLQLCGAVDRYILQLTSKDRWQYHQAYKVLRIFARLGIVSPFGHFLKESKDVELRCALIAFLGKTGDEAAYEIISKYLNEEQKAVRETAKIALNRIQERKWASIEEMRDDQIELEYMGS